MAPTAVPTIPLPELSEDLANTPECAPQVFDALKANSSAEFTRWNIIGYDMDCRVEKEFLLQKALRLGLAQIAYEAAMPLQGGYKGLEVLDLTGSGMTPLLMACKLGYAGVVKKLLELNATTTATDANGRTVMHLGAPYTDVVLNLLPYLEDVEAMIQTPDSDGNNPLCLSLAGRASVAVVKIVEQALYCCGENFTRDLVNTPNSQGLMPVHMADTPQVFQTLVTWGAELDVKNPDGALPCHTAARITGTAENGALDWVFRESASCDLLAKDAKDRTPLHYAAKGGDLKNCQWLISRRAPMDLRDADGLDSIDTAMRAENWHLVPAFRFRGSPLSVLVSTGRLDAIKYVVDKGIVDPNDRDPENGRTGLFEAAMLGHVDMVEFLQGQSDVSLEYLDKFGMSVLAVSIMSQKMTVTRYLLDKGAIVTQRLQNYSTALHVAAQYSSENDAKEVIEALLTRSKGERQAYLRYRDSLGRDALHMVATVAATQALLSAGAPLRLVDSGSLEGFLPLHTAALSGHAAVMEVFFKRDRFNVNAAVEPIPPMGSTTAPPEPSEFKGATALHLAARAGHEAALRMALRYCIDPGLTDAAGRLASDVAPAGVAKRLLQDPHSVEGRCTCDCGPYVLSPQFAVAAKWSAGCSTLVRCRWPTTSIEDAPTEAVTCKKFASVVSTSVPEEDTADNSEQGATTTTTTTTAQVAAQADTPEGDASSPEEFFDEPGTWEPASPRNLGSCSTGPVAASARRGAMLPWLLAVVVASGGYIGSCR